MTTPRRIGISTHFCPFERMREELVFWVFRYKFVMLQQAENQQYRKYLAKSAYRNTCGDALNSCFITNFSKNVQKLARRVTFSECGFFGQKCQKCANFQTPKSAQKLAIPILYYMYFERLLSSRRSRFWCENESFCTHKSRFHACLPYKIGRKK